MCLYLRNRGVNMELKMKLFEKIFAFILSKFWKNKNFVYINSNKKNLNIESIKSLVKPSDSKILNCQTNKTASIHSLKSHFVKNKIYLYQIQKNIRDNYTFYYCGFPSQMFSIYDGYVLGNTQYPKFLELGSNEKFYSVDFKLKIKESETENVSDSEEINLVIETSYIIDKNKLKRFPTYYFKEKAPNKITGEYLNKVYNFTKSFLDKCNGYKIKKVNLYITSKPSVSYVVGTAIQTYHPNVNVYEFMNNDFAYYLNLNKGRIEK